ncbi:MAG: exopolysaccharide biosynthesis polyprenyl glycosylphosphotransferase [Anaerolineales bacterium]
MDIHPVDPLRLTVRWQLRPRERQTLLILGDLMVTGVALLLALILWYQGETYLQRFGFQEFVRTRPPVWFFALPLVWLILMVELYDLRLAGDWRRTINGILTAAGIGLVIYLALFFFYTAPPRSLLPRRGVAGFLASASLLTLAWRAIYIRIFTTPRFMRRVLMVGAGRSGQAMLHIIKGLWPPPFYLVGILDDDPEKQNQHIEGYPVLGDNRALEQVIREHLVSDILVSISGEISQPLFEALLDAQENGVEITRMPVMYEDLLQRVPIHYLDANWLLRSFVDEVRTSGFYALFKRLLDILGGLAGTLVFVLFFPILGLLIFLDDGRPILYTQERLGRSGQPYRIIKFRTMRRDAEANGRAQWAKENDDRATRVGRILRKTHLDELPQFVNVLKGEMSLVGPRAERPELVAYFQEYVPFYRTRLLVKPGITGWAQVNYGYTATIEETGIKLEYDLYYIKHRSLWMDIVILLRTPWTVIGLRGL